MRGRGLLIGVGLAGALALPCSATASYSVIVSNGAFSSSSAGLIRLDPANGRQSPITRSGKGNLLKAPESVAIARDGSLYVADSGAFGGNGGVVRVDPLTGKQTAIARSDHAGSLVYDPAGITIAPDGTLLVTDFTGPGGSGALGPDGGVLRISRSTGAQTAVARSDGPGNLFGNPDAVAVGPGGGILVTDFSAFGGAGGVIRVNPASGAQSAVTPRPGSGPDRFGDGARGIALLSAGTILAAAQAGPPALVRVNTSTGVQSYLSKGGMLSQPISIALEPGGHSLLAADDVANSVFRVNTTTGAQSVLSHGSLLMSPTGVMIAPDRPVIGKLSISTKRLRRRATLRYTLSESASVSIVIQRITGAHKTNVRRLTRRGRPGQNSVRLSRRFGKRKLRPGKYDAVAVAVVPYAPRSVPRSVRFTIVK